MDWQKKEIHKLIKENKHITIVFCILWLLWLIAYFYYTDDFIKTDVEPIPEPTLTLRLMSALWFLGLWRLLYHIWFYWILYFFMVRIGWDRKGYNELKVSIWDGVTLITGFVIVPFIIEVLNVILSYLYNWMMYLFYILPIVWIPMILITLGYLYNQLKLNCKNK